MKTILSVVLCGVGIACTSKDATGDASGPHPAEREGPNEFDPGPPTDEAPPTDDSPSEDPPVEEPPSDGPFDDTGVTPSEDTGLVPEALDIEVCYPGELSDYTACFPIVPATSSMGDEYTYPPPHEGNPQYNPPTAYLDLRVSDHDHALSPNFVFSEFMSEAKGSFGFFQVHVVESLQAIREASGGPIYVNSGYRNVAYNESVGGATWSRHLYGDAVDMYSGVLSLAELEGVCQDMGADFTLLYDTHVHCDWRDHPLDLSFFD